MQYRRLGQSELEVSTIALGTATFGVAPDAAEAERVVAAALDAGINFFDCANSYGNQSRFDRSGGPGAAERESAEEMLGRMLASRRGEVIIGSKVGEPVGSDPADHGLSRAQIVKQAEASLKRLGTDYIDLYHAHHPDPEVPLEETLRAFDELIRAGKVRHCALSTYPGSQVVEVAWLCERHGLSQPVCNQINYNLVRRGAERDILSACANHAMSATVFSGLAGGLFAGKDARERQYVGSRRWGGPDFSKPHKAAAAQLEALAEESGHTPSELALGWVLSRKPVASVIIGAESVGELAASLGAADLAMTPDLLDAVDAIGKTRLTHWE